VRSVNSGCAPVAAYDTDYLFVSDDDLARAAEAITAAGHAGALVGTHSSQTDTVTPARPT
jgi:hypothetical protein